MARSPATRRRLKAVCRRPEVEQLENRLLLAIDLATADLNDDGRVNILDVSLLRSRFSDAGTVNYREGLDLAYPDGPDAGTQSERGADGVINSLDLADVTAFLGRTGAPTTGTVLRGRVFDGFGNPLQGVHVELGRTGQTPLVAISDMLGTYSINVTPGYNGFQEITFGGSVVNGVANNDLVDPTPGLLSGQYPTIPHKPVFVNGGTVTTFRDMSLPERDLTGSVLLDATNSTMTGPNTFVTTVPLTVDNAGVALKVPAGSTIVFPPGEDPRLSISRVDPARLPIPMPPGLSSSLFITYQPGETVITAPTGQPLETVFDNTDGYNPGNGPFLAGVVNGVFAPLATTAVVDADMDMQPNDTDDLLVASIGTPFKFAWYHVDIPTPPCPRTVVTGQVVLNDGPMTPVANAVVSVVGVGPVVTDANGMFSIFNVPAGPNGPFCLTNPFSLRASASKDLNNSGGLDGNEVGQSALVSAVPGGATNVGVIKLGVTGTVQGRTLLLESVNPFMVVPIELVQMQLQSFSPPLTLNRTTDAGGNFNFTPVPVGAYNLQATFGTVPPPENYQGFGFGSIDFQGDVENADFRFSAAGSVKVAVLMPDGMTPVVGADVRLTSSEGFDLGAGFETMSYFGFDSTDATGMVTFDEDNGGPGGREQPSFTVASVTGDNGVPLGPFTVTAQFGTLRGTATGFVNAQGQLVNVVVQLQPVADIASVAFTTGTEGMTPVLLVDVDFVSEFVGLAVPESSILVEFDTAAGGSFSEISFTTPPSGPTNLTPEFRALATFAYGNISGSLQDGNFNFIGSFTAEFGSGGTDRTRVILKIPQSVFGGATLANVAVLASAPSQTFFSPTLHDVVPGNLMGGGGFLTIPNLAAASQTNPDALGDTYLGFGGTAAGITAPAGNLLAPSTAGLFSGADEDAAGVFEAAALAALVTGLPPANNTPSNGTAVAPVQEPESDAGSPPVPPQVGTGRDEAPPALPAPPAPGIANGLGDPFPNGLDNGPL